MVITCQETHFTGRKVISVVIITQKIVYSAVILLFSSHK